MRDDNMIPPEARELGVDVPTSVLAGVDRNPFEVQATGVANLSFEDIGVEQPNELEQLKQRLDGIYRCYDVLSEAYFEEESKTYRYKEKWQEARKNLRAASKGAERNSHRAQLLQYEVENLRKVIDVLLNGK